MVTKTTGINVTFEETTADLLSHMAHQANISLAKLVHELTLEALEIREDQYLSKLATMLDKEDAKTYNHSEAFT